MDVTLFIVASAFGASSGFITGTLRGSWTPSDRRWIFVGLWVIVFDRLGLYRRTYALIDERRALLYGRGADARHDPATRPLYDLSRDLDLARRADRLALGFSILMVGSARADAAPASAIAEWFKGRRKVSMSEPKRMSSAFSRAWSSAPARKPNSSSSTISPKLSSQIDLSRDPELSDASSGSTMRGGRAATR